MRIGFVTTIYCGWGGSEELWSQAALKLVKVGHSIFASVPNSTPVPAQLSRLADAGCAIASRVFHRPRRLFERRRYRWLDAWKPDFVVLSLAAHHHGADWMAACRSRGIPYAILVQSGDESHFPADTEAAALAAGYEGARRTYFVAARNADLVRRSCGTPLRNPRVVRNPYGVDYGQTVPWPADGGQTRLACVARLEPLSKGQDLLFDVLSMPKWRDRAIRVDLYGTGLCEQTLRRFKDQLGLVNVTFAGFTVDITTVWRENHALVLPSRFEGLPLALVEAMLCGRPCIVTDVSGNAELVEDGRTGFVAAAATARHLDEAMSRAWDRRHEWERLGRAAADEIRQRVPADPASVFADDLQTLLTS